MPKRKAASKISGLADEDGQDVMQTNGNKDAPVHEERVEEPPVKRPRGRPKSAPPKAAETDNSVAKARATVATSPKQDTLPKKPAGRGRPKAVRAQPEPEPEPEPDRQVPADVDKGAAHGVSVEEEAQQGQSDASNDELDSPKNVAKPKRPGRPPGKRGRRAGSTREVRTDGEFEYTPTASKHIEASDEPENATKKPAVGRRRAETEENHVVPESEKSMPGVEETILPEEQSASTQPKPVSPLKSRANGHATPRNVPDTNRSRGPGSASDTEKMGEAELRRRLNDMTKKYESLEAKFRDLREIGIVEANANLEKMRKQCEATAAGMMYCLTRAPTSLLTSVQLQINLSNP